MEPTEIRVDPVVAARGLGERPDRVEDDDPADAVELDGLLPHQTVAVPSDLTLKVFS